MEVDKKTVPTYINLVLDDDEKYFAKLRTQADVDSQNDDDSEVKHLSVREEGHIWRDSEIYFENGELYISGNLVSEKGSTYVCISVPISQEVLFDILGEAVKKFNKVKTVLEATK